MPNYHHADRYIAIVLDRDEARRFAEFAHHMGTGRLSYVGTPTRRAIRHVVSRIERATRNATTNRTER